MGVCQLRRHAAAGRGFGDGRGVRGGPGAALLVYGDALYTDERSQHDGLSARRASGIRSDDGPQLRQPRRAAELDVDAARLELAGPFDERGYYFFDFEFYLRLSTLGGGEARAEAVVDLPRARRVEDGGRHRREVP